MFSNEQISNPTIESSLKDWREQGGLTRLEGSKCPHCDELFYPRRFVCPYCFCRSLKTYKFSGMGKIKNIEINSISQVAVIGYREISPRYLSVIELAEGVDVLGEIIECSEIESIHSLIGREVMSVVRKQSSSGNTSWKYGYKFKLKEG